MYSLLLKALFLLSAFILQGVQTQGQECYPYASSCADAPFIFWAPPPGIDCIIDPSDPSYIEVEFSVCPCQNGALAYGSLIYTANPATYPAQVTTASALNSVTLQASTYQTVTLSFNVPYTGVEPGAPVTIVEDYYFGTSTSARTISFTPVPAQTVYYSDTTTTITNTFFDSSTTTFTATEADITVFPGPTTTARCTTGTNTVTGRPSTITTFVTQTPASRTITKTVVSTVTTTLTCLPSSPTISRRDALPSAAPRAHARHLGAAPDGELLAMAVVPRQQYLTPVCANQQISYTTIYTSTGVVYASTTTTATLTAYTTSTSYTSSTLPPQTLCKFASTSVTVTPTTTKVATTHLAAGIVTNSVTATVTKTVVPRGLAAC